MRCGAGRTHCGNPGPDLVWRARQTPPHRDGRCRHTARIQGRCLCMTVGPPIANMPAPTRCAMPTICVELIYLEETTQQPWTRKMIEFLRAAKKEADAAKGVDRAVSPKRLAHLRRHYARRPDRRRTRQSTLDSTTAAQRAYQTIPSSQSAHPPATARSGCAALSHRSARALRQQPGRTDAISACQNSSKKPPGVSVPSPVPTPSPPFVRTSPRCANRGATYSTPSPSPFKVKHQIPCLPGKLNSYGAERSPRLSIWRCKT